MCVVCGLFPQAKERPFVPETWRPRVAADFSKTLRQKKRAKSFLQHDLWFFFFLEVQAER